MNDLSPEEYNRIESMHPGWYRLGRLMDYPPVRFQAHPASKEEWILTGNTRDFDDSLEIKSLKDGRLFWSRPGISVLVS